MREEIYALVTEILKLEKWVKYANWMTDHVIHATQYYIEYIELSWPICNAEH